jgi:hypothetical protein
MFTLTDRLVVNKQVNGGNILCGYCGCVFVWHSERTPDGSWILVQFVRSWIVIDLT